ncbi:MAG TPA: hypothetical protein VHJ19_01960 [Gammaproteobacteria bacterium]|nr:hypothetical protein [Gammaproteobacteria bacterium]
MKGKVVGIVEFDDWWGMSRRAVWNWIEEDMPHVKDDTPHTDKAYRDGIILLETIDRCRKT